MELDKDMILKFLKSRGDDEHAAQAERELPDRVDTDKDSGLLQRFGVEPGELLTKLKSGDLGDLKDKLGNLF